MNFSMDFLTLTTAIYEFKVFGFFFKSFPHFWWLNFDDRSKSKIDTQLKTIWFIAQWSLGISQMQYRPFIQICLEIRRNSYRIQSSNSTVAISKICGQWWSNYETCFAVTWNAPHCHILWDDLCDYAESASGLWFL